MEAAGDVNPITEFGQQNRKLGLVHLPPCKYKIEKTNTHLL